MGQRGAKGQPGGRSTSDGGLPWTGVSGWHSARSSRPPLEHGKEGAELHSDGVHHGERELPRIAHARRARAGLIEQVGKQATYAKVAENFQRIATDLTTCRDLSVLLSPPAR